MLKEIDTKDDLEVLAKLWFSCRVYRLFCLSTFQYVHRSQLMGGYLRWLNAAPEPDDEVFIILLSSLWTIYPLRFWMQITMFWRHLIDFGTGWLQTTPAKRRVLDQVILRSNTKMKSRSNSPGWGKVRKSRSWRRCWRWRRWPSRVFAI